MEKSCIICNQKLQGNQQKYCSNACKQKAHWNNIKKQTNSYHSQTKRGIRRKLDYVNKLGGKCSKCGYNKNLAALEFNHVDPSNKLFDLNIRKLSNTTEKSLLLELSKCNLLCSNCHREHHYPNMEVQTLSEAQFFNFLKSNYGLV